MLSISAAAVVLIGTGAGVAAATGRLQDYWTLGFGGSDSQSAVTVHVISLRKAAGHSPLDWRLIGSPSGSTVHIYIEPPCSHVVGAVVTQTPSVVTITVYGTPKRSCVTEKPLRVDHAVKLGFAIGGRQLAGMSTGS